jgi:hypothetical protein
MNIKSKYRSYFKIIAFILILLYFSSFDTNILSNTIQIANPNLLKSSDKDDIFGEIDIISPAKSEVLLIGQNFTIKWSYKGSIEFVTIALYRDHTFVNTIIITTPNDGEYLWFIPNYEESFDYSIGIWDYNDFNNNDFSDYFTISTYSPHKSDSDLIIIIIGISVGIIILSIGFIILKLKRRT